MGELESMEMLDFFFSPPPPTPPPVISTFISVCMIGDAMCPGSSTNFDMVLSQNRDAAVCILNTLEWLKGNKSEDVAWSDNEGNVQIIKLFTSAGFIKIYTKQVH